MKWCERMNWAGRDLRNGALLDAAEQAGFEMLLTCDQNVRYQQNFAGRKLALVVPLLESLAHPAANGSADRHRG